MLFESAFSLHFFDIISEIKLFLSVNVVIVEESMVINFLTGSLAFREHKTGVHIVHENLIKLSVADKKRGNSYKISCYNTKKEISQYCKDYLNRDNCTVLFSNRIVRIFAYFLPIELFFGKADLYICDGLIPHVIYKSKRIAIIHDMMVKIYPQNYSPIKRNYLNYYFKMCRKADRIIAVSETTKRDIIRYLKIDESKIDVVPNGYSSEDKTLNSINRSKLRKERYVFYIGDMRPNKNLLNAIKGVEIALNTQPDLKFYIAGKKSHEYEKLMEYVHNHDLSKNIIFCGYISDEEKEELYRNSLGLLFVSYYEGFGIPILEAASYNTPVITSNCSSMKEIAENTSLLVDPDNPKAIGETILKLLNCEVRNNIIKKQKMLLSQYTWINTYEKFIKSIDNTLSS